MIVLLVVILPTFGQTYPRNTKLSAPEEVGGSHRLDRPDCAKG